MTEQNQSLLTIQSPVHMTQQTRDGEEYYTLTTNARDLGITKYQELIGYIAKTLHEMTGEMVNLTVDPPMTLEEERNISIPAHLINRLTDDQKRDFFAAISPKLQQLESNREFFEAAVKAHRDAGGELLFTSRAAGDDFLKTKYELMYGMGEHGIVNNDQVAALAKTINRLVDCLVAGVYEYKNESFSNKISIHEDGMLAILASPNRDAILAAISHPEKIKKGYLAEIIDVGKGADNRPGSPKLLKE